MGWLTLFALLPWGSESQAHLDFTQAPGLPAWTSQRVPFRKTLRSSWQDTDNWLQTVMAVNRD